MTRVIHTGDTHIGYRQYNAPERRRDFLRAFRRVADDAMDLDVDAVVHAGDLFHDRRPGLVDLQSTLSVLRDLDDAGIPFLAVVGNHEGKRDAQWLDLFADLGLATRLGREPYRLGEVALYGLDFVPRSRREDLEYEFADHDGDHAALVTHGLFSPFAHADWETETLLAEADVEFDALLLGDNHEPGTAKVEDTWVTYCGSTERASASERESRGYNVVEFDDAVEIRRRGIESREFVFVDVTLHEGEGGDVVRERVGEYDVEDAVVVVTVEGEGEPITPATIETAASERGALVARVTDRREIDEETEVSVNFADPDEAVRKRVRDLGLSDAARDIDRVVRDDDLADANVRDAIERRVREGLEESAAFEPASGEGGDGTDAESDEAAKAPESEASDDSEAGKPTDESDDQISIGEFS
ncbi:DNA double-strand break repair protein Mre11 [Saliphagus sp. LR7]|uniref:DNA double-strand break repair protein Mre11 n=1 Tax=Saliphagus sp. LR7 TaxID=2282654 RepID=UPI000DF85E24|nr:DNA double-strand break repair protein Mre11 [Saliphagus sp. LR7]